MCWGTTAVDTNVGRWFGGKRRNHRGDVSLQGMLW
jgi:hypothetical protein